MWGIPVGRFLGFVFVLATRLPGVEFVCVALASSGVATVFYLCSPLASGGDVGCVLLSVLEASLSDVSMV